MYQNYPMSLFDRQKFVFNMTDDVNERLDIQHKMFMQELNAQREREQLIDEITERVLQRISVSVDIQKALMEIKELKQAIDSLCQ
ncbi:MAG: hypothetical protein IJ491_00885 [Clostridia bacterium]|nr:hypothetical protein [Clostridia bacterium]